MMKLPRQQSEHGQMTLLAAAGMIVLLGLAALTIDIGFFTHTKREAQNDADAMSLAGARDLPVDVAAEDAAEDWGYRNGVIPEEITDIEVGTTCSDVADADVITVRLKRNQKTFLASVLGIKDADLNVCATAKQGVAAAGNGMMPFGFHYEDPYPGPNPEDVCFFYAEDGSENPDLWNNSCLIKIPKVNDSWGSGNSGPVRLDEGGEPGNYDPSCNPGSSGASEYEENIEEGSECYYAKDDLIRPKTGNMRGPTCSAFDQKLAGNSDTLEDVFGTPDENGVYGPVDTTSPRYGLVPIVTASGQGSSADVTIKGFITVYIEDACSSANCNGNGQDPACVVVTPVKSNVYISGVDFAGGDLLDSETPLRVIKLVE
jgi:hypothetical protein